MSVIGNMAGEGGSSVSPSASAMVCRLEFLDVLPRPARGSVKCRCGLLGGAVAGASDADSVGEEQDEEHTGQPVFFENSGCFLKQASPWFAIVAKVLPFQYVEQITSSGSCFVCCGSWEVLGTGKNLTSVIHVDFSEVL